MSVCGWGIGLWKGKAGGVCLTVGGWGTGLWKGKAGRVCLSVGGGLACGKVKLEECV